LRKRIERLTAQGAWRLKRLSGVAAGRLAVAALGAVRRFPPHKTAEVAAGAMRRLGPWTAEHRVGQANLRAAFPNKSANEIEHILGGVWDNMGRIGAEYAHLDRIWDYDPANPAPGRIEASAETISRFLALKDDGKPALIFAAHLANWELPAVAAATHGVDSAVLYRRPNDSDVADMIQDIRSIAMGRLIPTSPDAVFRVASELERGAHVGMLVDQHFERGVDVTFFGRTCKANPMLARLARHFDCPIHGTRVIRLPGDRFRLELTEAIEPARDGRGQVDVQGTMQRITGVIEGWIREYPEQWLWLHRRWR
jgi:KDO2-lipid IV(A) lauroyltransferase